MASNSQRFECPAHASSQVIYTGSCPLHSSRFAKNSLRSAEKTVLSQNAAHKLQVYSQLRLSNNHSMQPC